MRLLYKDPETYSSWFRVSDHMCVHSKELNKCFHKSFLCYKNTLRFRRCNEPFFQELLEISGCFWTFETNISRICDNRAPLKSESLRSAPAAEAVSPRGSCSGLYPAAFLISPKRETIPHARSIHASASSPSLWKSIFWCSYKASCVEWMRIASGPVMVPLERAYLCLLHSFLPSIYELTLKMTLHWGKFRERYQGKIDLLHTGHSGQDLAYWIPEVFFQK